MLIVQPQFLRPLAAPPPQGRETLAHALSWLSSMDTQVIGPTAAKSPFQLRSSQAELTAALRAVCQTAPDDPDIGNFLRVLDCWLTEAFGWWTEVELTGQRTVAIGNALIDASRGMSGDIATSQSALGGNFVRIGSTLARQGSSWKQVVRSIAEVSPGIRDTVLLFNQSLDDGTLNPDDPDTDVLRQGLIDVINGWKFQIVMRAVDAGFLAHKFARSMTDANTQVIASNFNIAAMTPQAIELASQVLAATRELLDTLDLLELPNAALSALAALPGKLVEGVARGASEPTGDFLMKVATAVGALGLLAVGATIVLKKTGVIGKDTFRK